MKNSFKQSVIYTQPLRFTASLLLVFLSFGFLSFAIIQHQTQDTDLQTISTEADLADEDAGPVTTETRAYMLEPSEDTALGTEDETDPPEEEVRKDALAPREESPSPEDNEPVPADSRRSFLE